MPMTEAESEGVRLCTRCNRPHGTETWTRTTAERLGSQSGSARLPPENVFLLESLYNDRLDRDPTK